MSGKLYRVCNRYFMKVRPEGERKKTQILGWPGQRCWSWGPAEPKLSRQGVKWDREPLLEFLCFPTTRDGENGGKHVLGLEFVLGRGDGFD